MNIVGHSHGGNIGILVSQMTERKIDTLVTLGTPVRSDYKPNYTMIGNHLNAYSNADPIQVLLGGKGGYDFGLPKGVGVVNSLLQHFLEFGPASRKFEGAENMAVTKNTGWGPGSAHTDLWKKASVWSSINATIRQ